MSEPQSLLDRIQRDSADFRKAWPPAWRMALAAGEVEQPRVDLLILVRVMAGVMWRGAWNRPIEEIGTKALVGGLSAMLGSTPRIAERALEDLQRARLMHRSGWSLILYEPRQTMPDIGPIPVRTSSDGYALSRRTAKAVMTATTVDEARVIALGMYASGAGDCAARIADVSGVDVGDVRRVLLKLEADGFVRFDPAGGWSAILPATKATAA
jgi:hypothetical protein